MTLLGLFIFRSIGVLQSTNKETKNPSKFKLYFPGFFHFTSLSCGPCRGREDDRPDHTLEITGVGVICSGETIDQKTVEWSENRRETFHLRIRCNSKNKW